jgi:flagellar basal body-associated protein FliL
MIDVALSLLVLPPQAAERINFELEPGVVLFAILFFVLVNLLLAVVLYPYLTGSSEQPEARSEPTPKEDLVEEVPSDGERLENRVDDFLEDIEQG